MMGVLKAFCKSILDFLLFSNVFIALCAVAQALVTYHLLSLQPDYYILAFLFLSTLALYNFCILLTKPARQDTSPFMRIRWLSNHHRLMVSITLIAALAIVPIGLFYMSFQGQLLMGFTGVIALAYGLPFLIIDNKKIGLRNLPGIKLFLIALVWAVSTVLFPIIEAEHLYNIRIPVTDTFLLTFKRFLFVAAITIPFDIRDLFQDKLVELKTIPVMLGEKKAHLFCMGLLLVYLLLLILFSSTINVDVLALSVVTTLTIWLIFASSMKKNEYFYFLFLDGTMILQFVFLAGFSWLFT